MVECNSLTDFGFSFIVWWYENLFHKWRFGNKYSTDDCCYNTNNDQQLLQNKRKIIKENESLIMFHQRQSSFDQILLEL